MLSGNEHSHDERLTADDADGKTDFLAGVGLKNVRENKKTPIGEEGAGDSTEVNIFPQGTIFQNIGTEKSIAHPICLVGRRRKPVQDYIGTICKPGSPALRQ